MRRVSDFWEWSDWAFIPGIFSNMPAGEIWADGDDYFSQHGATSYSTADLEDQANMMSFVDGIQLRQLRARPKQGDSSQGHRPLFGAYSNGGKRVSSANDELDTADYGYGGARFKHWTVEELGGNPAGVYSGATESTTRYPCDGYTAYIMPFFSSVPLRNVTWDASQEPPPPVPRSNRNGAQMRYYCVRTSTNGVDVRQVCASDPGANHDIVRHAAVDLMGALKEGHWLDFQTRLIDITLQLRSPNSGLMSRVNLLMEFPETGGLIPSFRILTKIDAPQDNTTLLLALVQVAWPRRPRCSTAPSGLGRPQHKHRFLVPPLGLALPLRCVPAAPRV